MPMDLEPNNGWGYRYYFDEARAKAEIEAWLICRRQLERGNRHE